MGLDYYSVLGLTRSAQDSDVKNAFRKLALKYHPSQNDSADAQQEYARICEAYDVLCQPAHKGFYDLHGEVALKNGMSDGSGGTKGGTYSFAPSQCDDVFRSFFGTDNLFAALEDLATSFQSLGANDKPKAGKKQVHALQLTLEEISTGCLKKVQFERRRVASSGEVEIEQRELTVDVKPGMPDGTCFVFDGEGNEVPGKAPGPVVFVLEAAAHPRFTRDGSALRHRPTVPLHQALAGGSLSVALLDGTAVSVPVDTILTPGHTITVPNKGLPDTARGFGARGDLVLEIDVLFPSELSEAQKTLLRAALFLPKAKERCDAVKAFTRAYEDPQHGWCTGVLKE